jgi:Lrp/AsnC family transcriptional regulator for asnA, asnC and gidA
MTTIRGVANGAGGANGATKRHRRGGVNLDDVSKTIIELLQQDGRKSYASIATEVGLSEAAVRQRVQRLLDADVMQIVAVTDPLQVGFQRQAMIGLRVTGDMTAVADALSAMDEVSYVVTTAGSFDVLAEVVCEDDDHLLELLTKRIRTLEGVLATETFVYLKLNKQLYNWGTR